jgi:hypothetical protein
MGNTKGSCLTALLAVQSTAHAKGRIERNHGTHQDRLVKKLRRKGIGDLAAANAFLEAEYWVAPNRQFAQEPGSGEDFHVPLGRGVRLDAIFRLEESRTVSKDWVVRYDNRLFQLERESGHAPARSTVLVHEDEGGGIEIRYRGRLMRATEITAGAAAAMATTTAPASPGASAKTYRCRRWRTRARACGSCLSRGRTERAHRSLESTERFPQLPQGTVLIHFLCWDQKGDISIELRMGHF